MNFTNGIVAYRNKMKIIYCSYRNWANNVLATIQKHPRIEYVYHAKSNDHLYSELKNNRNYDLVVFCGWSTPPDEEYVNLGVPMVSEHPATSDRYSPGTPLQNQILDGLKYTKHRIVKVGFPELSPRKWSHEVEMDLNGNMDDILYQMEATSKVLFNKFFDEYPNITWKTWEELPVEQQIPRRIPSQSEIKKVNFADISAEKLYDMIRCLESPYPNAFIEDETGRLYFERVRFESK